MWTMAIKSARPALVLAAVLSFSPAVSACRSDPRYPVTERSAPFSALDASKVGSAPPVARTVTFDRIRNARSEPQNWLTYYGSYNGQRYSTLDQINAGNVRNLKAAWVFQTGVIGLIATPATYAFEAAPIVVDGVMYVTGWDGYIWALDAATG
jgi:alcohol dehydrogenase (cytochrome c)